MSDPPPDVPRCEYLEWDSSFFGHRIARVAAPRLGEADMARILGWCRAEAIECLYLRTDPGDHPTIALAEDHGFRLMDIRVTLGRPLGPGLAWPASPSADAVRSCVPGDIPALQAIARASHHDTRFYCDPHFSDERCDALYDRWIEKLCTGEGNGVQVAELDGQPVGYCACSLLEGGGSDIGLLAVDARARGRGMGGALVNAALGWLLGQGAGNVTACTQGHNLQTQRLYQRRGFLTLDVATTYHRWFAGGPER